MGKPDLGSVDVAARTLGPDLVSTTFTGYWVYLAGQIAGAAVAVVVAFVLRGRGGGESVRGLPRATS